MPGRSIRCCNCETQYALLLNRWDVETLRGQLGAGVCVFAPTGELLEFIPIPEDTITKWHSVVTISGRSTSRQGRPCSRSPATFPGREGRLDIKSELPRRSLGV